MAIFINGIGSISAQQLQPRNGIDGFKTFNTNRLTCQEPDYKDLVPPMQLRRMSKVVRMGIASAKQAVQDAHIERPDLITIGTAYGCLADTESFLTKLLTQDESMLTPTAFIQSTHNTVSGQIALMMQCQGHNFTYVHRGHSFETSLQEAMLWLAEKPELNILVGGIDELTNGSFDIISRFGTFKKDSELDTPNTEGTRAGEGSNSFILSGNANEHSYAKVVDVCLCKNNFIEKQLHQFLQQNNASALDIDTCLVGTNDDVRYDTQILKNINSLEQARLIHFKNYCGEYPTSTAFALSMACSLFQNRTIQETLFVKNPDSSISKPETILIYNHYKNQYHSFILVKRL